MGLLDSGLSSIGGLLSSPRARDALLMAFGAGVGPDSNQRMALMARTRAERERMEKEEEYRKLQQQQLELQLEAAKRARTKEDLTGAMITSVNQQTAALTEQLRQALASGDQAAVERARANLAQFNSADNQSSWRQHLAAYGDVSRAEQAGVIPPLQAPEKPLGQRDYVTMASQFTPESIAEFQATNDPTKLQRLPPQAAPLPPERPLSVDRLVASGAYTPESIAKWSTSNNPADLVLASTIARVTPAEQREQDSLKLKTLELSQAAGNLRRTITDPKFSEAVGLVDDWTAPLAARMWPGGTEAGKINAAATRQVNQLLTAAIKTLGANPSDRDMQALYDTMPRTSQQPNVWLDWYNNEFVPTINLRARMNPEIGQDVVEPIETSDPKASAVEDARAYVARARGSSVP